MKYTILILFLLCSVRFVRAQSLMDSIQRLDEVVLSDIKLKDYAKGYKINILNDSILRKNGTSLTDVLRFNSNIYFKENGYGMVSSPSFRGTNASQTAVIWNGININSQLNGQVDFNTLSTANYDAISIRSGGGSVQYGSGAIGGSVHLSNTLDFKKHFEQRLQLGYGSFDTKNTRYKADFGNGKISATAGLAYVDSENDFEYLGSNRRNENGAFNNLDINFNLGYVLNDTDVLKVYHQNFRSDREFSGTLLAPSKSKYKTEDYRSMLEWAHIKANYTSNLKAVHLSEQFQYFENKDLKNFSEGKVNTWLLKHRYKQQVSNQLDLSIITDYSHITGRGDSFENPSRNAFSATAIMSHRPTSKLRYALNIRQDFISDFESPLVFSGDLAYQMFKPYVLKLNVSKNYRVPTFNDLYWNPGGNLNLKPESSYQLDLGHELKFKSLCFNMNTFYIETSDLIQWRPNGTNGSWNPVNVASARQYGLETELNYELKRDHDTFLLAANYSYTEAEDIEKAQRLFYVPLHKANASLSYNYKAFTSYYQHLYNGEIAIIGGDLKAFDVANFGVTYTINRTGTWNGTADFRINNLYNTYYENVAFRPMPNRNYTIKFTLNF